MVVAAPKDFGSCNDRAALTDKSPGNRKYTQQEKDEFFAVLDTRFLEWQHSSSASTNPPHSHLASQFLPPGDL
ncbi:hypothetical protein [Pseudarthrobacter sp. Y6]|uniref:hypothetical protein n=1 Tax=Pseudarthrobacter sp. Y6 TaxID=3418422 RepID=UPI003CF2AA8B